MRVTAHLVGDIKALRTLGLILVILEFVKDIISKLKTKITPTWVKGHYEGDDEDQVEYTLNRLSHSDAVNQRKNPPHSLKC